MRSKSQNKSKPGHLSAYQPHCLPRRIAQLAAESSKATTPISKSTTGALTDLQKVSKNPQGNLQAASGQKVVGREPYKITGVNTFHNAGLSSGPQMATPTVGVAFMCEHPSGSKTQTASRSSFSARTFRHRRYINNNNSPLGVMIIRF